MVFTLKKPVYAIMQLSFLMEELVSGLKNRGFAKKNKTFTKFSTESFLSQDL